MIVVLDTNILISSIFWRGAPYKMVLYGLKNKYSLHLSAQILDELEEKLRIKFKLPEENIQSHIEILKEFGKIIEPNITVDIIKDDPTDNKVIECAVSCNADYIVSGDKHLLNLKTYKDIKVLSAKEFLDMLEKTNN